MSTMRYYCNTYAITTASHIGKKNHVGIMPVDSLAHGFYSPLVSLQQNNNSRENGQANANNDIVHMFVISSKNLTYVSFHSL